MAAGRRRPLVIGFDHAVSILPTPSGNGYWVLLYDGSVYTFGDAQYLGGANGIAAFAGEAIELVARGDRYSIIVANRVNPGVVVTVQP